MRARPSPHRRSVLRRIAVALCCPLVAVAQQPLRGIAVLPLDFLDDQHNPATVEAQNRRLQNAHAQLQREVAAYGLYRVVDLAPAQELLGQLRAQQEYMHRCPDCALQIGRKLGADLVMTTWVQKVSELILNFNVEIYDIATGRSLLSKSVDMRGNQDASWERAVHYLVRDMAEKRAGDPHYGL
jgi:hypothetical protein